MERGRRQERRNRKREQRGREMKIKGEKGGKMGEDMERDRGG